MLIIIIIAVKKKEMVPKGKVKICCKEYVAN